MKKIILIIILIFVNGCTKSNHILNINSIQSINYDNIILINSDFDLIKGEINRLKFTQVSEFKDSGKNLDIVSKDKIYKFNILNNEIYYKDDSKYYVSTNIDSLNNILDEIHKKYTDLSFFNVEYNDCKSDEFDLVIKMNSSTKCLILNTDRELFNFKIHSLDFNKESLNESELLYQKNEIDNKKIVIKALIMPIPKIGISFDTKYNYTVSILPTYNEENNQIELNTTFNQKNRQVN